MDIEKEIFSVISGVAFLFIDQLRDINESKLIIKTPKRQLLQLFG